MVEVRRECPGGHVETGLEKCQHPGFRTMYLFNGHWSVGSEDCANQMVWCIYPVGHISPVDEVIVRSPVKSSHPRLNGMAAQAPTASDGFDSDALDASGHFSLPLDVGG